MKLPSMSTISDRDAIRLLVDALAEYIASTPDDELLAEVAEDYGDWRVLAAEFDVILRYAVRRKWN
ncbi:MAG: hypothetical protein C5B56_05980 [Proteobacteria bacterium]|nr:MAG: hypothetical protein C5B56_05980 [Pseudomonadota bacterium]